MPVILIGFMGTGKSTVGRLLAESMNQSFCDLDELIEKEAGMTILLTSILMVSKFFDN